MIQGFAKFIYQYLAPLMMLTSLVLIIVGFLAPVDPAHTKAALLTVKPSLELFQTDGSTGGKVDGPSVLMGLLGSCSRNDNAADFNCTGMAIHPVYDTSALPDSGPGILVAPHSSLATIASISLVFTIFFFFLFTLSSFRSKMGAKGAFLDKPLIQRLTTWLGVIGFIVGLTTFLVVRMWFGKAVDDFNKALVRQGNDAPRLIAQIDNAFILIYVGYAFFAVPLVCSLARFHQPAGGSTSKA
ncbi:hypothetical protein K474DRAFT_784563 [Panus rudis PR-1116 ss-1]|nr:hypothetical protein K474DRAFT_784563 [Panus rudis PR-1116 ss-1]